ncbi:MAG: hypothetical protein CMJ94_03375 [Planctomycetes bacterium]|nr:hypothetical protein [Planctomycetota bacterium]
MFTWMKLRPLALMAALTLTGASTAQTDRSGWQAELSMLAHDVRGVVTVVDDDTIRLDNFSYDGLGIEVRVTLATGDSNAAFQNGLAVGPDLVGTVFNNDSLVLDLPAGETTRDYRAVSIWCVAAGANFGSGLFEHPRAGWQADLSTLAHQVDGIATIVDHNTVRIDDFDYDGLGIEVYVILAEEDTNASIAQGLRISGDLLGMPYSGDTVTYDLPAGETVNDYHAISVWCEAAGANFGSGTFAPVFSHDPGTLRAGAVTEVRFDGATSNSPIVTAYSLNGSGPTNTPLGIVDLSLPIRRLPNTTAWVNGAGYLRLPIPSGSTGITVWMQSADLATGKLSPVTMSTIQ